jgi:hypothetical protein
MTQGLRSPATTKRPAPFVRESFSKTQSESLPRYAREKRSEYWAPGLFSAHRIQLALARWSHLDALLHDQRLDGMEAGCRPGLQQDHRAAILQCLPQPLFTQKNAFVDFPKLYRGPLFNSGTSIEWN